jgi:hypothetical protein
MHKRNRILSCLAPFLVVLSCSVLCSADQINLTPVLNLYVENSDNIFYAADDSPNKVSDTYYTINPGVGLDVATGRSALTISYQAGVQRFDKYDNRNNTIQRVDGNVGYKFSKRFALNVMDNFAYTDDPLAFDASGDRVQRGGYKYNHLAPTIFYQFPGHTARLGLRYERIDVDYEDESLIDSSQNGFHGQLDFQLGTRTTFGFAYDTFKREFDQASPMLSDYDGNVFTVVVDRRLSTRTSVRFNGGYEWRNFDRETPTADWDGGVYGVSFQGNFPEFFSINVEYAHRFNDLAASGVFEIDKIGTSFKRVFAERFTTEIDAFWQRNRNKQVVVLDRTQQDDFAGGRILGEFVLTKFLNVQLGYEYLKRDSNIINSFHENRFLVGFGIGYGI